MKASAQPAHLLPSSAIRLLLIVCLVVAVCLAAIGCSMGPISPPPSGTDIDAGADLDADGDGDTDTDTDSDADTDTEVDSGLDAG